MDSEVLDEGDTPALPETHLFEVPIPRSEKFILELLPIVLPIYVFVEVAEPKGWV